MADPSPPEVGPRAAAAPEAEHPRPAGRAAERAIQLLIPAVAALTLLSFETASGHRVEHDLHLLAPPATAPGETLPLRAHLFGDLERPEGPRLITREVTVELVDGAGAVRASTRLSPGYAGSLEGSLTVPRDVSLEGARLRARAEVEGRGGSAERGLVPASATAPERPEPRALRALGSFAPGPLRVEAGAEDPPRLDLVVGGGACVPEVACELLVHTGSADVALVMAPSPALSPVGGPRVEAGAPVARLSVIVHGPEAEVTLSAERAGVRVASRAFRLPVALGASALTVMPALYHAPALPSLRIEGEAGGDTRGCIVDAYRDGRWLRTGTSPHCDADDPLPLAALDAGLWRLQVRRDAFDSSSAAVRALYVRGPGEADAAVLSALAAVAAVRAPDDLLAARVRANANTYLPSFEPTARYLLALLETGLYPLPQASSGYAAAQEVLAKELSRMRDLALWALGLSGLLLVLMVLRRGLAAGGTAAELMQDAGAGAPDVRRARQRSMLTALAAAASLALAFVAIAIYVIARSMGP